jgi:hypothetical protein
MRPTDVSRTDSQFIIRYLLEQRISFQLVICILPRKMIVSRIFGDEHRTTKNNYTCVVLTDDLPLMILDGSKINFSFHTWVGRENNEIQGIVSIDPFCIESIHKYPVLFHQPIPCARKQMKLFNLLLLLKKMAGCIPITPVVTTKEQTVQKILNLRPAKPIRRHSTASISSQRIDEIVDYILFRTQPDSGILPEFTNRRFSSIN